MDSAPPPRERGELTRFRTNANDDAAPDWTATPRFGWFAGVLEGSVGNRDEMRAAADAVRDLGIVGCDLEILGGRFSFLFDEDPVPGERLTVDRQDELLASLAALVEAAADGAAVESTLRSSLVHPTSVVETLFSVRGGQLEPISRRRDLEERDRAREPQESTATSWLVK